MREGMIVVPKFDNSQRPLQALHAEVLQGAVEGFGGVTMREAYGAWQDPKTGQKYLEPVVEFVVAYDPDSLDGDAKLTDLARLVGDKGRQEAVYVRYASGDVEIIDMTEASGRKYPLYREAA